MEHSLTVKDLNDIFQQAASYPIWVETEEGELKPAAFKYYHSFGEGWCLEVRSLEDLYEEDSHLVNTATGELCHDTHEQETLSTLFRSKWFTGHMYSDAPVYAVKKFCMWQRSFSKMRVEECGLVFYNTKEDVERCLQQQAERDRRWKESVEQSKNLPSISLPIIRRCEPSLLAEQLVSVEPMP